MATIYNWPSLILPATLDMKLKSNRKQFTSPFNGATQVVTRPGASWGLSMTFENLDDTESRELEVLIAQLDAGGKVRIPDFGRRNKGVNKTVSGANQTGLILTTSGWTAHAKQVVKKGDYLEVNGELKIVTATGDADGAGRCSISIAPMLRKSPPDASPVVFNNPCGLFRLVDDENGVARQPAFVNGFSLSFREAFY